MIWIRPYKSLILALSFVFIGVALVAETEGSLKLYPLPLTELEGALSIWLTHSGFQVRRTSLRMGQVQSGSSGSPVFDAQGNLVAIVKGRYRGTESVGFLIPLATIIESAKET